MAREIVLLHDAQAATGRPDASDTLLEVAAVADALHTLGYATTTIPVGLDLEALEVELRARRPHAVVNLVESLDNRGRLVAVVPALLESLGVPYTGCSPEALAATSHKVEAKKLLVRADIATPALYGAVADEGPWIVKSVFEHASLGIDDSSVVQGADVRRLIEARRAELGGDWFAERYVAGRELNVGVIAAPEGARVLPVAEIEFKGFPAGKPAILGYAAKWHADSFECRNTVRSFGVEAELGARAARLALACWELFALDGYARVDFRVDAAGLLLVLEVNANPCLSPDAGFAAALAQAGVGYRDAIGWLIEVALRRARPGAAA